MTKPLLKISASILLLGSVAACGDNDTPDDVVVNPPEPPPPPPPPPTGGDDDFADMFGRAFAVIFDREITQDPIDPQQSDVPPLAPASDPIQNDG
ncbi:MAG: hypothetical protein WA908_11000 [Pontixanthobacter sp.]